ncbi:alpha/beta hydrolase [Microseira wollei]|uniref:Alpha/beta hydrolase domain-containing protein n=1 Tax=Microseira wollei NIES-4236 TaxID=2530354 RepID=A0AAV3XKF8_9CYAN|nr:alpha/beta hydrolase [Microseira wollei]GET43412.1 alpha/beta hydrolase domain-containing protein [Microseira wollei NIES-4236]
MMKRSIRLAMVMLVGFLVFSLSVPGVALSAEIDLPIPLPQSEEIDLPTGYQPINCDPDDFQLPVPPRGKKYHIEFPTGYEVPSDCDSLQPHLVELNDGTVSTDITYATLSGFRPLSLDLYQGRDTGTTEPRPLVVFVHGGAWTNGHERGTADFIDFPSVFAALANSGYVVASLEYRLSGEAPFPAAIKDVKRAIHFLRSKASEFGINKDKIALWGASAGANLTSLASVACDVPLFKPEESFGKDWNDCVQGFVGWYGPYDLVRLFGDPRLFPPANQALTDPQSIGTLAYFQCIKDGVCPHEILSAASAVTYVDKNDPPMLLIHGKEDTVVPYNQSEILAAKVKEVHEIPKEQSTDLVKVVLIDCVNHDFRGQEKSRTHQASMKALWETFTFLDKLFLPNPPEDSRWVVDEQELCPVPW